MKMEKAVEYKLNAVANHIMAEIEPFVHNEDLQITISEIKKVLYKEFGNKDVL